MNSIRLFNAYGPRSRTTGAYGAVFGVFLRQKLAGMPLTVVGDGTRRGTSCTSPTWRRHSTQRRKLIVSDRCWNLGAGNPQSVNALVALIGGPVVYIPKRPGEPDCTWADITKIQRELGWKPAVSFKDGVQRMMDKIELWSDAPLWDIRQTIAQATKTWFEFLGEKGLTLSNLTWQALQAQNKNR